MADPSPSPHPPAAAVPDPICLDSDRATRALGRALADGLLAGDVLLLSGPVGAGKSLFARAVIGRLLERCGQVEDIPSPSYTLVQTYQAGPLEVWHADLYRLGDPGEVVELGLDAAFDTALCLVEWPGALGEMTPPQAVTLDFAIPGPPGQRLLSVTPGPATRPALIAGLAAAAEALYG